MSETKITSEQLVEIARKMGAEVQTQKSFHKIVSPEQNRKAAYVAISKRTITRVDFSGFEPEEHAALVRLTQEEAKELNLGAVRGQILPKDLSEEVTDEDILDCFRTNLALVLSPSEGFKLAPKAPEEVEVEKLQALADEA